MNNECICLEMLKSNLEIQKLKFQIADLINKLDNINRVQMYIIKLQDYKVTVVCEHCFKHGEVNSKCNICGGKGTHFKTKQRWQVYKYLIDIIKIDRNRTGEAIRYWEDSSCFFKESDKLIHFTYQDALNECKKRNEE